MDCLKKECPLYDREHFDRSKHDPTKACVPFRFECDHSRPRFPLNPPEYFEPVCPKLQEHALALPQSIPVKAYCYIDQTNIASFLQSDYVDKTIPECLKEYLAMPYQVSQPWTVRVFGICRLCPYCPDIER